MVWSNKDSIVTFSHNNFGSSTTYTFSLTSGKDMGGNELIASRTITRVITTINVFNLVFLFQAIEKNLNGPVVCGLKIGLEIF